MSIRMDVLEPMTPVIFQDAYEAAQALLDSRVRLHCDLGIVICSCQEFPNAWVFGYNTRRFLEESEFKASLVGNGPVVVPKSGTPPFLAGSGRPVEEQIWEL
jgi:hypothetical protein